MEEEEEGGKIDRHDRRGGRHSMGKDFIPADDDDTRRSVEGGNSRNGRFPIDRSMTRSRVTEPFDRKRK